MNLAPGQFSHIRPFNKLEQLQSYFKEATRILFFNDVLLAVVVVAAKAP